MSFEKLPAYEGPITRPCLCCSPTRRIAHMDMLIAVGFGSAVVTKDREYAYDENRLEEGQDYWTVQDAESEAMKDPERDWRIVIDGPLRSMEYQRHGEGQWVLVKSGEGFA